MDEGGVTTPRALAENAAAKFRRRQLSGTALAEKLCFLCPAGTNIDD